MNAIISFLEKIGLIFDPSAAPDFSSYGQEFFIDFKGLGIGQFKMNPVAINVLNGIRWYGILITIGIILAFTYVCYRAKQQGYVFDDLIDLVLFVVPLSVLGARLFYVFTADGYDLKNWYKIWDGGLAIYGAIIVGALMVFLVGRYKKMRIFRLMDCVVPGVMVGQLIGRWGNFCNGEAFGAETSSIFGMGLSHIEGVTQVVVHPTFLYESLWNLTGFILINIFYNKKKFDGQIVLEYLGWYGLGRFFIELLRQDSLPLKIGQYNLRISCVIGLLCFIACAIAFLVLILKPKNPNLKECCYYPDAKRYAEVMKIKEEAEKSEVVTETLKENEEVKEENHASEETADDSEVLENEKEKTAEKTEIQSETVEEPTSKNNETDSE